MPLSYVFVLALAGTQQPRFPVWCESKSIRSITQFWYLNPLTFVEESLINTLN